MSEKQMELRSSMENKLINHVEMSCEWEVGKCYIIVSTVTGVGMENELMHVQKCHIHVFVLKI